MVMQYIPFSSTHRLQQIAQRRVGDRRARPGQLAVNSHPQPRIMPPSFLEVSFFVTIILVSPGRARQQSPAVPRQASAWPAVPGPFLFGPPGVHSRDTEAQTSPLLVGGASPGTVSPVRASEHMITN